MDVVLWILTGLTLRISVMLVCLDCAIMAFVFGVVYSFGPVVLNYYYYLVIIWFGIYVGWFVIYFGWFSIQVELLSIQV